MPLRLSEGRRIGLQLNERRPNQDQALMLRASFDAQNFHDCAPVARIAAKAVAGFGGVGNDAALFEMGANPVQEGRRQSRCGSR